jgi:hypothetical protein
MPDQPFNADPVPATPIGDMTAWQLHIQCGRCRRHIVLPLSHLVARHGKRTRIGAVIRRLRCDGVRGEERCHGRPKRVVLVKVETYGATTRRLRELHVVDTTRRPTRIPEAAGASASPSAFALVADSPARFADHTYAGGFDRQDGQQGDF